MTVWEYRLLQGCAENTENQANSSGCWHNSWDFCTLGLKCSTCLEGICLHERRSKPSTSLTPIHCSRSYSYAAYHCKSSDYSAKWLLMIHPSDSFLACEGNILKNFVDFHAWEKNCKYPDYSKPQWGLIKVYVLALSHKLYEP